MAKKDFFFAWNYKQTWSFEVGGRRRRRKAFAPPETHKNLSEFDRHPRRLCTLRRLLALIVSGISRWHWWWWCADVVGVMMIMRRWWWWWRRRVTRVRATRCRRVASGEIYSTCVVILVVVGIMSSLIIFVLAFVGVFGPLSSRAMRARPLSTEAATKSGMEPWCGAWLVQSRCRLTPFFYVGGDYSAPSVGRCSRCW